MDKHWSEEWKKKYIDPLDLPIKIREIRLQNKKIATLNGSFDLMHAGHLHIIYEASQQADILIVALNSDQSIQKYKSPTRPIISLPYRLQMMSALSFVHYVTYFDETTPLKILIEIKPDVHVNGSEYGENCLEAETVKSHGGRLHIVPLIPGLSTSQILHKIATLQSQGA